MSKLIYTAEQVDLFGEYNQTKVECGQAPREHHARIQDGT
jgi:hypothetical protein